MYHAIVRRNVSKLFEALGRGDVDYAVAGMAPRFEHIFPGDHTPYLDTQIIVDAMRAMAAAGVAEAVAPKIED